MIAAVGRCGQVGRFPCALSRKITVLPAFFRNPPSWRVGAVTARRHRAGRGRWVPMQQSSTAADLFPPRVDGGDVLVGPAEVMGKFMHHHMGDQICQTDIAAFDPFFQNGTAKKPDRIGLLRLI